MSLDCNQGRERKGTCGKDQPYHIDALVPWAEAHCLYLLTAMGIIRCLFF